MRDFNHQLPNDRPYQLYGSLFVAILAIAVGIGWVLLHNVAQ